MQCSAIAFGSKFEGTIAVNKRKLVAVRKNRFPPKKLYHLSSLRLYVHIIAHSANEAFTFLGVLSNNFLFNGNTNFYNTILLILLELLINVSLYMKMTFTI